MATRKRGYGSTRGRPPLRGRTTGRAGLPMTPSSRRSSTGYESMNSSMAVNPQAVRDEVCASRTGNLFTVSGLKPQHWKKIANDTTGWEKTQPENQLDAPEKEPTSSNHTNTPADNTVTDQDGRTQADALAQESIELLTNKSRKRKRNFTDGIHHSPVELDEAGPISEDAQTSDQGHQKNLPVNAKYEHNNGLVPAATSESLAQQSSNQSMSSASIPPTATDGSLSKPSVQLLDEKLTEIDLPPPFLSQASTPSSPSQVDPAEQLLRSRFHRLPSPSAFVNSLTKENPSVRTTENLYLLALNTQRALVAWQDEYLSLEAHTAPLAHPPKRPATGGRVPIDPELWEGLKEAELYNYTYDTKKEPWQQNPFFQRAGRHAGGRELRMRQRQQSGMLQPRDGEGGGSSEDTERATKRVRRAVVRYDGTSGTVSLAEARRGLAGSATPETEDNGANPPRRRGRPSQASLLQRLATVRSSSAFRASTEERDQSDFRGSPARHEDGPRRRGRPPGSKNLARRIDAGIKKGPRNGKPAGAAATGQASGLSKKMAYKRKQRIKSEKRSHSMTLWWAERKAKAAAAKEGRAGNADDEKGEVAEEGPEVADGDDDESPASEVEGLQDVPEEEESEREDGKESNGDRPLEGNEGSNGKRRAPRLENGEKASDLKGPIDGTAISPAGEASREGEEAGHEEKQATET